VIVCDREGHGKRDYHRREAKERRMEGYFPFYSLHTSRVGGGTEGGGRENPPVASKERASRRSEKIRGKGAANRNIIKRGDGSLGTLYRLGREFP